MNLIIINILKVFNYYIIKGGGIKHLQKPLFATIGCEYLNSYHLDIFHSPTLSLIPYKYIIFCLSYFTKIIKSIALIPFKPTNTNPLYDKRII